MTPPTITPAQFKAIFPTCPDPAVWAAAVSQAWAEFGFVDIDAQAGFFGITGNETGGYTYVAWENMNYSAERAVQVFGRTRSAPCVQYCDDGDNGMMFGSCIYANMLGNGPLETHDGFNFRGVGIIQLTGRSNHQACATALGIPVDNLAVKIAGDPVVSARAAAWFMADYAKILPLLETGRQSDFLAAAQKVGYPPDSAATQTRLNYWTTARLVLTGQATPPAPVNPARPPLPPMTKAGDRGPWVTTLQAWLNHNNDSFTPELVVDGSFGDRTREAVLHFQEACGLDADGVVGNATWAALMEIG